MHQNTRESHDSHGMPTLHSRLHSNKERLDSDHSDSEPGDSNNIEICAQRQTAPMREQYLQRKRPHYLRLHHHVTACKSATDRDGVCQTSVGAIAKGIYHETSTDVHQTRTHAHGTHMRSTKKRSAHSPGPYYAAMSSSEGPCSLCALASSLARLSQLWLVQERHSPSLLVLCKSCQRPLLLQLCAANA